MKKNMTDYEKKMLHYPTLSAIKTLIDLHYLDFIMNDDNIISIPNVIFDKFIVEISMLQKANGFDVDYSTLLGTEVYYPGTNVKLKSNSYEPKISGSLTIK